ncbi:MAG: NUDIX hydrolase N-terminal domain-containing protein [Clostridiales bacterium]|nr:NUDIX hydrolase N-terminal domain-containing protein [Clostridiales bacterium]
MTKKELNDRKWVAWARELQSIAQCGQAYGKNPFDLERYERIREISVEILAQYTDLPPEQLSGLFSGGEGYRTPKVTTRSALFQGDRVLLVRETCVGWNLPGGWCDENQTVRTNAEKELWEETGIRGRATRLVAVQDRNLRNWPPYLMNLTNHLFLCEPVGEIGPFRPNLETQERGFFPLGDLPPLDTRRTTQAQLRLCWEASQSAHWETVFD